MKTIKCQVDDLYEIKKSEFYSFLFPVSNMEDVNKNLTEIRKQHKTARHICYACLISQPRIERCSDDGEPDGTAGKPLLELLKKKNLENVLLVVVRYFGGIKLGAGGLIRAYTNAGVLVCNKAEIVDLVKYTKFTLSVKTLDVKSVLSLLKQLDVETTGIEYGEDVKILVKVKSENEDIFKNNISGVAKVIKNE